MRHFWQIVALSLLIPAAAFSATPLSGWSHVVPVETDATLIPEAVPVIPVFLSEGDTAFWAAVKSDGSDIRVTEDDGSTILPHYLVSTFTDSGTTGTGCLLVNVSSILSAASDVEFWIHVGNAGASSTSSGSDVFSGTSIEAFYMPGITTDDITGNGYDLTAVNSPTTAASDYEGVTAAVYNGTTQYHYSASFTDSSPIALELVVYPNETADGGYIAFDTSGSAGDAFTGMRMDSGGEIRATAGNGGSGKIRNSTTSSIAQTTWQMVVADYASSEYPNIYIDGALSNGLTSDNGSFGTLSLGPLYIATGVKYTANIRVAQAAIHSVVRSADYVSTNYNAWHDASFLTFGATESGGSATGHPWFYRRR